MAHGIFGIPGMPDALAGGAWAGTAERGSPGAGGIQALGAGVRVYEDSGKPQEGGRPQRVG